MFYVYLSVSSSVYLCTDYVELNTMLHVCSTAVTAARLKRSVLHHGDGERHKIQKIQNAFNSLIIRARQW